MVEGAIREGVTLAPIYAANTGAPKYIKHKLKMKGLPRWLSGKESASNSGDQVQSLGWEDTLEKEMATHSSILAWEIPWAEEPGGLQSMGSQRVRRN